MVGKTEAIGGIFRGLVTGGSWIRLTMWAKSVSGRRVSVQLEYSDGLANWTLTLFAPDGSTVFTGSSSSLEGVTIQAVAALGKER